MATDAAFRAQPDTASGAPSRWRRGLRALLRDRLTVGGIVIIGAFFLMALFASVIAPQGENQIDPTYGRQTPSWNYLFGTDQLGRDVFSRVVLGSRISVAVGLGAAAVATPLALSVGMVSGYAGGWVDLVLQRLVDAFLAIPPLILLTATVVVFGAGLSQIILILGVFGSVGLSRVIRGNVLLLKNQEFVHAARAAGAGPGRVMLRHILPNLTPILLVTSSNAIAGFVVAEGALSFLGLGIEPPTPSWGSMLAAARPFMNDLPYLAIFPGAFLAFFVLGWYMLGDGLRDTLDPRMRNRA